jgi:spore photoproduct lyase
MNSTDYYTDLFDRIYLTEEVLDLPKVRGALECLDTLPARTVDEKSDIPGEHMNARTLFITLPKGEIVDRCPGTRGHLCCNYLTVNQYLGCTLGCSYCIMRWYLNFEPITVHAETREAVRRIEAIRRTNPDTTLRIGTGEVGDSLLLDPLFNLSRDYIEAFADDPLLYFELKTKTDFVDHLEDIPRKGNAVIGFSLNPEDFTAEEESCTASVERRFAAAERAVSWGYKIAFHFDPIVTGPRPGGGELATGGKEGAKGDEQAADWRGAYFPLADRVGGFPADKVAWISMGTFRYPPELKDKMGSPPYLYDEYVPSRDGKYRYLQKRRVIIYREMLSRIRRKSTAPVYLCMESDAVWKAVFGKLPGEILGLEAIFSRPRFAG